MSGWPFGTSPIAPGVDSDFTTLTNAFVAVPTTPVGSQFFMIGLWIKNKTGAAVTLQIKDVAGNVFFDTSIPDGFCGLWNETPVMPLNGQLQWKGLGLLCKLWGW